MADLVVPPLGESITEAVVAKWLKNVGDTVAADEPLAELETDKITVQLPSPVAGVLAAQAASTGATVRPGDVIGVVDAGQQARAAMSPAAVMPPAAATATMPAIPSAMAAAQSSALPAMATATIPAIPSAMAAAAAGGPSAPSAPVSPAFQAPPMSSGRQVATQAPTLPLP